MARVEAGPGCKRAPRLMLGATLASIFLSLLAICLSNWQGTEGGASPAAPRHPDNAATRAGISVTVMAVMGNSSAG